MTNTELTKLGQIVFWLDDILSATEGQSGRKKIDLQHSLADLRLISKALHEVHDEPSE